MACRIAYRTPPLVIGLGRRNVLVVEEILDGFEGHAFPRESVDLTLFVFVRLVELAFVLQPKRSNGTFQRGVWVASEERFRVLQASNLPQQFQLGSELLNRVLPTCRSSVAESQAARLKGELPRACVDFLLASGVRKSDQRTLS